MEMIDEAFFRVFLLACVIVNLKGNQKGHIRELNEYAQLYDYCQIR